MSSDPVIRLRSSSGLSGLRQTLGQRLGPAAMGLAAALASPAAFAQEAAPPPAEEQQPAGHTAAPQAAEGQPAAEAQPADTFVLPPVDVVGEQEGSYKPEETAIRRAPKKLIDTPQSV